MIVLVINETNSRVSSNVSGVTNFTIRSVAIRIDYWQLPQWDSSINLTYLGLDSPLTKTNRLRPRTGELTLEMSDIKRRQAGLRDVPIWAFGTGYGRPP